MGIGAVLGGASILGGLSQRSSASSAQRSQERALAEGREISAQATEQARGDVNRLFAEAQEQQAAGFQQAQQLFGQTIPQQADVFQAGNVAAQQQLLSGLPQFQQAILGGPIDFSALQPTQLQQPDFGIFAQVAAPPPQPEPTPGIFGPGGRFLPGIGAGGFGGIGNRGQDLGALLSGLGGGGRAGGGFGGNFGGGLGSGSLSDALNFRDAFGGFNQPLQQITPNFGGV